MPPDDLTQDTLDAALTGAPAADPTPTPTPDPTPDPEKPEADPKPVAVLEPTPEPTPEPEKPPAARTLAEIAADYQANKAILPSELTMLQSAWTEHQAQVDAQAERQARIDKLFPTAETSVMEKLTARFGLNDDQQLLAKAEIGEVFRELTADAEASFLGPYVNTQGAQLEQMGFTAAQISQIQPEMFPVVAFAQGQANPDPKKFVPAADVEAQVAAKVDEAVHKALVARGLDPNRGTPGIGGSPSADVAVDTDGKSVKQVAASLAAGEVNFENEFAKAWSKQ